MPGFILDVQGLKVAFKIPEGRIDAFNNISLKLTADRTFSALGKSGSPVLATCVNNIQGPCTMVPVVYFAAWPRLKGRLN